MQETLQFWTEILGT